MNEGQAKRLKSAGVDRVTTIGIPARPFPFFHLHDPHVPRPARHDQERTAAGLGNLLGRIVGMGEQDEDLIELAMALREVEPDSIPLNTLQSRRRGTPLEHCDHLTRNAV